MTEDQKKRLETQLWHIANELRGKMNADEFRDYCLGFIFYKYLLDKLHQYANAIMDDGDDFTYIDENSNDGKEMLQAIRGESVIELGYFLKPSELFSSLAKRATDAEEFILADLSTVLNINRSISSRSAY
jgi:type I restriction enzyme M protein